MKIPFGKFGPKINPVGAHCTMPWKGGQLLGTIHGISYREVPAGYVLDVRHFNGEPWPIQPGAPAVDCIERTYEDAE